MRTLDAVSGSLSNTAAMLQGLELWAPNNAALYIVTTSLMVGGTVVDAYDSTFGFRSAQWKVDGFYLHGVKTLLVGADVHQDHGGWSNAVTDSGFERDVRHVREAGMNFIRGSYTFTPGTQAFDGKAAIEFRPYYAGTTTLTARSAGLPDATITDTIGAAGETEPADFDNAALWRSPTGAGSQIVGGQAGRCVDVPKSSTTNGTQVQLWDCGGGSNQRWATTSSKQLKVYGSKCLDANGRRTSKRRRNRERHKDHPLVV